MCFRRGAPLTTTHTSSHPVPPHPPKPPTTPPPPPLGPVDSLPRCNWLAFHGAAGARRGDVRAPPRRLPVRLRPPRPLHPLLNRVANPHPLARQPGTRPAQRRARSAAERAVRLVGAGAPPPGVQNVSAAVSGGLWWGRCASRGGCVVPARVPEQASPLNGRCSTVGRRTC